MTSKASFPSNGKLPVCRLGQWVQWDHLWRTQFPPNASDEYDCSGVSRSHHLFCMPITMFDDTKTISHLTVSIGVTVSIIALGRYLKSRGSRNKSKLPYPPGPKGLPLIGNILDLPRDVPVWEGFAKMAETYRTLIVFAIGWRTYQTFAQRPVSCILTCSARI